MENNKLIIEQFELLLRQIMNDIDSSIGKERMENSYRYSSIKKVIKILKNLKKPILSTKDIEKIEGIGKKSIQRIDEILKTKKLQELREIDDKTQEKIKLIDELTHIFGIGQKTANRLIENYNIKTLEDFKDLYNNGTIELSNNIIKGLKFFDKINEQIPREIIDEIYVHLTKICKRIDPKINIMICGSYRRKKAFVNDIDVLIFHDDVKTKKDIPNSNILEKIITKLMNDGFIIESFTSNKTKKMFMGLCKYKNLIIRIDIKMIPIESKYSAIIYFTGSGNFNQKIRKIAKKNNYKLNEYGLFDENNRPFSLDSEETIFEKLNLDYMKPELRD